MDSEGDGGLNIAAAALVVSIREGLAAPSKQQVDPLEAFK